MNLKIVSSTQIYENNLKEVWRELVEIPKDGTIVRFKGREKIVMEGKEHYTPHEPTFTSQPSAIEWADL